MAQDLSVKKNQYLNECVAACNDLADAYGRLNSLKAKWASNATYSGIILTDIKAQTHLTPAILAAFMTTGWPAMTAVVTANLAGLLDMIGD